MHGGHGNVEDVFEARQLGHGFLARRGHHLVWRPLRDKMAVFQHNDSFAECKNLFPAVGDINDRNMAVVVPGAKIVHNPELGGGIERRQRFVEQEDSAGRSPGREQALLSGALHLKPARAGASGDAKSETIPGMAALRRLRSPRSSEEESVFDIGSRR